MKAQLQTQLSGMWAIVPDFDHTAFALRLAAIDGAPATGEPTPMMVQRGSAVIDVSGALMRTGEDWMQDYGVALMDRIGAQVKAAADSPDVDEIILNIDSPGGTVNGTAELASIVADAGQVKPVTAFSAGMMCSAAYWIGSQADNIIVSPSSVIGSIGVLSMHVNAEAQYAQDGIEVQVFRSGENKAIGAYNTALTEAQKEHIQSKIDSMAVDFFDVVTARRDDFNVEFYDGRTVQGSQGVATGLADGNARDLAEVIGNKLTIDG